MRMAFPDPSATLLPGRWPKIGPLLLELFPIWKIDGAALVLVGRLSFFLRFRNIGEEEVYLGLL